MLDYIWLDDRSPILYQLPRSFKSAALLLHPFVQMPPEWEKTKRKNPFEHVYPDDDEILTLGKSVSWQEVMTDSDLDSYTELALALLTSIGAFKKEYERKDLANKLNSTLKPNLYYPPEDSISIFLLKNLLTVLCLKGARKLYFSDPIFDNDGLLTINDTSSLDICNLSGQELIVTDENMDYAFMSLYDSFTTLLFMKNENIEDIIQLMNWEAVICDQRTSIDWYLK